MSHYLPSCVVSFFEAPEIKYQPTRHRIETKMKPYDTVSSLLPYLTRLPARSEPSEQEKRAIEVAEWEEARAAEIAVARSEYDRECPPLEGDAVLTTDPHKTLFVGRLDYNVDNAILQAEFERYGTIVSCRVVHDPISDDNKSLGYGFVEFSTREQCEKAYHDADGAKILSKHIVVDYERRRSDPNWFPARLNGGEGMTRHRDRSKAINAPGRTKDFLLREQQRIEEQHRAEDRRRQQDEMNNRGNFRHGGHGGRGGGGGFRHGGHGGGNRDRNHHGNHGGGGGSGYDRFNNGRGFGANNNNRFNNNNNYGGERRDERRGGDERRDERRGGDERRDERRGGDERRNDHGRDRDRNYDNHGRF